MLERNLGEWYIGNYKELNEELDQEIDNECGKLNNNKSAEDNINAEVLKYVDGELRKRINTLVKIIWQRKKPWYILS